MNFVNKLISRITAIVGVILVFIQAYLSLFMDQKDVTVFITSLVFGGIVLFILIYHLVLFKKYHKNYDAKFLNNDVSVNTFVVGASLVLSIIIFLVTYFAYLYLIFGI